MSHRVFIIAGEPSGDTRAASLCRALIAREPDVRLRGFGGEKMKEAGVELVRNMAREGVVGLWEVLHKLNYFASTYREAISEIRQFQPDAVILVDFPGFNLQLARQLNREGIPVIYYISPQVWAWRKYRIQQIRRCVDLMMVLFQFEEELYRSHDVPVKWVGHPLVDDMTNYVASVNEPLFPDKLNQAGEEPVIGVLPGSRTSEFTRLYPRMRQAVRRLQDVMEVGTVLVPVAEELDMDDMKRYRVSGDGLDEEWLRGRARDVMKTSDILLTASGTTTLEAAILETPMVVCYRVNPITWAIGLMLIETDHIGLVNLVANERIVPECIQWDATPERLSDELQQLLEASRYNACKRKLGTVREKLGPPGASERAATTVLNFMDINSS